VVSFQIDYSSELSLHNWIDQYSLYCISVFEESMIGSCFLIGAFLGSFVLPRLADIVGRKPMFLLGLALYILTVTGLMLGKSI
jgi:MFS family permease